MWTTACRPLPRIVHARHGSSAGPRPRARYLFPQRPQPSAHEIFHLPPGASQSDIKSRYYELVREHHPDSALVRHIPPAERRSHFQAITAAYDVLSGKCRSSGHRAGSSGASDAAMYEELRRRRAARHRSAGMDFDRQRPFGFASGTPGRDWTSRPDERWKDWSIIIVASTCFLIGIAPIFFSRGTHRREESAIHNLAQARNDAQEFGLEQRREIRRRVREYQAAQERLDAERQT